MIRAFMVHRWQSGQSSLSYSSAFSLCSYTNTSREDSSLRMRPKASSVSRRKSKQERESITHNRLSCRTKKQKPHPGMLTELQNLFQRDKITAAAEPVRKICKWSTISTEPYRKQMRKHQLSIKRATKHHLPPCYNNSLRSLSGVRT